VLALTSWTDWAVDMTATAPTAEVIRDAVRLACRAPSLHNSQPWRWVAEGATLQLWADLCQAMTATDHTGRELTLSYGAVFDHLRVAMAAVGWESATERFPEQDEPNHLATLKFRPIEAVAKGEQLRADAIRRRRTDRLPFEVPANWPALQSELCRAVFPYDVLLDVVAADERPNLAEASLRTETLRRYDTTYLSELRWWTSSRSSRTPRMCQKALWCPPPKPPESMSPARFPGWRGQAPRHHRPRLLEDPGSLHLRRRPLERVALR
jgi:hypothetical protein